VSVERQSEPTRAIAKGAVLSVDQQLGGDVALDDLRALEAQLLDTFPRPLLFSGTRREQPLVEAPLGRGPLPAPASPVLAVEGDVERVAVEPVGVVPLERADVREELRRGSPDGAVELDLEALIGPECVIVGDALQRAFGPRADELIPRFAVEELLLHQALRG